ncbi:MAG: FxDxF family PEP-CTERM protein [Azoarcus sp.]|jgi:hypothetical protein|nr:FxDxF family PEP-CTERM protein [Azoarcus sp.]
MKRLSKLAAAMALGLGFVGLAQAGNEPSYTLLTGTYRFDTDSTWSSVGTPTGFYFDKAFQHDFHFNFINDANSAISLDLATEGLADWSVFLTNARTGETLAQIDNPTGTFDVATLGAGAYSLSVAGTPITVGQQGHFDIVIKSSSVTAVPEPETYAMLLAGLGLVGAVARRRMKA